MKTREQLYAGGTGSGTKFTDDKVTTSLEYPKNNSSDGFLKKLFINPTVTAVLTRNVWLRTIIYHILDSFIHKTEDRAKASEIGADSESTDLTYITASQLPSVGVGTGDPTFSVDPGTGQDFEVTTVVGDLTPPSNKSLLQIVSDTTSTNIRYKVRFSDVGWKWLMERTKPYVPPAAVAANANFYVDGNTGSDTAGDGSILKPYATLQYTALKAKEFNVAQSKPVSILVYASTYTLGTTSIPADSTTVIIDSVNITCPHNLWIEGGWEFKSGCAVNVNFSSDDKYLFDSGDVTSGITKSINISGGVSFDIKGGIMGNTAGFMKVGKTSVPASYTTSSVNFIINVIQIKTQGISILDTSVERSNSSNDRFIKNTLIQSVSKQCYKSEAIANVSIFDCYFQGASTGQQGQKQVLLELVHPYMNIERCQFWAGAAIPQIKANLTIVSPQNLVGVALKINGATFEGEVNNVDPLLLLEGTPNAITSSVIRIRNMHHIPVTQAPGTGNLFIVNSCTGVNNVEVLAQNCSAINSQIKCTTNNMTLRGNGSAVQSITSAAPFPASLNSGLVSRSDINFYS